MLEALAASVPVIATPNGFAKELIKDNVNGLLVDYGCVEELIKAMEFFMFSEDQLLRMKCEARNTYIIQQKRWNCYYKHFEIYYRAGLISFNCTSTLS